MKSSNFISEEQKRIFDGKLCPYCDQATELIDSSEIYQGVSYARMYICRPCNAYVGCYTGSEKSLGMVANAELRYAKRRAHHYFD